jgi:dipeptidyl aminopeptidase/acylaminoacyl peptidase
VRLSPDGSECVVLARAPCITAGHGYRSSLSIAATGGRSCVQLPTGDGECGAPRWSPDGTAIAFVSDAYEGGRFDAHVWRRSTGSSEQIANLDGSVEALRWSDDGRSLLVLVADVGADTAGADTGTVLSGSGRLDPDPQVIRPAQAWRRLVEIDLDGGGTHTVSPPGVNVWEFDWRGQSAVAVVSEDPSEGAWFDATLAIIDPVAGTTRTIHHPTWQIAGPCLFHDGRRAAVIEGCSSDRGFVAGTVIVFDLDQSATVATLDLDAAWIEPLPDGRIAFAGWKGLGSTCGTATLAGTVDRVPLADLTITPDRPPKVAVSADATIAAVTEAPGVPPEVRVFRDGWKTVAAFAHSAARGAGCSRLCWAGRDGLDLEGVLLQSRNRGSHPAALIVDVHGGPSDAWSFSYGRYGHEELVRRGYAVLLPNPRGSYGYGGEFGRLVWGDPGGEDLWDILSGVDRAIAAGVADPGRIGVMGGSYGGFMAAWATTQTRRFGAAVAMAPVTDWRSFHYTSNIGRFDELFLQADPTAPAGPHISRSPLTAAARMAKPTLLIHGALDRCTPVTQSRQYHNALVEAGVETEMVVYPREGHGWREVEHQVDLWRRTGDWFDRHLRGD